MLKINKWRKEMGRKHSKMLIVVICRCGNCGLFIVRFLYIFILFLCCLNFLQLTYFNFYNHKNVVIKTWLRIPKDFSMIKVTKWVLIVYWLIFNERNENCMPWRNSAVWVLWVLRILKVTKSTLQVWSKRTRFPTSIHRECTLYDIKEIYKDEQDFQELTLYLGKMRHVHV